MTITHSTTPTPDPRLLQANERTLLAWVRTGISLVAFGFVIARFGLWLSVLNPQAAVESHGAPWIGASFVILGVLGNALAVMRYAGARAAIFKNESLPALDRMPLVFTTLVTIACALVGAYVLMRL